MNILFLSTEIPFPLDHGHHLRTYHVLRILAKEHKIYFVCFAKDGVRVEYQRKLEEMCERVDIFTLRFRGWRQLMLVLLNLFSTLPLIAQKYYDARVAAHIKKLIDEAKIDLIHIDLLHIASYRRGLNSTPAILVNHNVESLRMLRWARVERNLLLKGFLLYQHLKLKNFEKSICREFDRCAVVSDYDKEFLFQLCGGGNFVTIPNGVDVSYFQVSDVILIPNSLVWVGSMSGPYNRDAVIYFLKEIWSHIQSVIYDAKVMFVGSSPANLLERVAKKSPNVEYTGYVDDVRSYVAQASVFIAPLRSGSGTKIKVLNAMSQGKPVVTTSIGAEGIEAKSDEEIIVADDPQEFAEKTIYLLQHPKVAEQIGLRARKVIEEKYDWKVINAKIRQVYDELGKESTVENKYEVTHKHLVRD